jgi:hypothetical protein
MEIPQAPDEPLSEPAYFSNFANGTPISRPVISVKKYKVVRSWRFMTATDIALLKAFIDTVKVGGDTFVFYDVYTDEIRTLFLLKDSIPQRETKDFDLWKFTLTMAEA